MITKIKSKINNWLTKNGVYVKRQKRIAGITATVDLGKLIPNKNPVVLDVGANRGQSIRLFESCLRSPTTYAFEPSTEIYNYLLEQSFDSNVQIFNYALGSKVERKNFYNYNKSGFNSFLEVDRNKKNPFGDYLEVKSVEEVDINTIDLFLSENNIEKVDLLKIDTQGYDLEVIKGGSKSIEKGMIKFLLVELNLINLYKDQNSYIEMFSLLNSHNYQLIDLYDKSRKGFGLDWCNGLFMYNA